MQSLTAHAVNKKGFKMKIWNLFLLSLVKANHVTLVKDKDVSEGSFLSTILSPNTPDLVATMHCNRIEECNHLYKNDTGIYFLSSYTAITEGTGSMYFNSTFLSKYIGDF